MATFLRNQCKQIIAATVMATTITFGINGANGQEIEEVKGAGASFPQILYQRYRTEYQEDKGVNFKSDKPSGAHVILGSFSLVEIVEKD